MTSPQQLAVVTGASRGIGRVIAERLADRGQHVIALARSVEALTAEPTNPNITPLAVDVSDPFAVSRVWHIIEVEHGVPTLLVNNAAIGGVSGPTWTQEPSDWWRLFEINVRGTFLPTHHALPAMIARGSGRIVNFSSGAAYFPVATDNDAQISAAYMSSKAAVQRFTEALAGELVGTGVTVFAMSPGMVKTDMTAPLFAEDWEDPDIWSPPELSADLIEFIDSGAIDALSGRFIHVAQDDWRTFAESANDIVAADKQTLRLVR